MFPLRTVALSLLLAVPAAGQDAAPDTVTLTGPGIQPVTLDPAALAVMPMLEQDISFESHGGEKGHYKGVLLWDILTAETGVEDDIKTSLRNTVLVTARDGHQVAWSIGDLAPDFGNDPVMLAVEQDGKPLDKGLRMVVPGDKRGARNIRDVTRIELR